MNANNSWREETWGAREHPRLMWILLFLFLLPYVAIEALVKNLLRVIRFPGFTDEDNREFFVVRSMALAGAALPYIYRY